MKSPKALVLRAAGINCEAETTHALELAGANVDVLHVARVLEAPARLDAYHLLVVPGGFSYGDDISAGRVFGLHLRHFLSEKLGSFVDRGGHVLGVCNGFQVLVESGIFEREAGARTMPERNVALYANASNHYECRWVTLRTERSACTWLAPEQTMPTPVAHGEGRFMVRDASVLARLEAQGQIVLRYANEDGSVATSYPANPNGATSSIAGICDPTGRVLGLMPHPERNLTPWNHPNWTRLPPSRVEGEGAAFYRALVDAAAGALV
jgi:phosphoribosylformylglycinamidine synthase subunit PurQ / glutaminase